MKRIEYDETFLAQLKRHEGLRLEAYKDTEGVLTIGWGHNCEASPVDGVKVEGDVIRRADADTLLTADLLLISTELDRALPWWRELDEPRQGVILNMGFNLGVSGLLGFRRALGAMKIGDYARAGTEMLDSRWAGQVRGRAAELARQMVLGCWE